MFFGEKLKKIREQRGMSQEEFGALLNTSKQVISRYETGLRTPKITVATEYARALNVPLAALIDDTEGMLDADLFSLPGIEPAPKWVKKPLIGSIACGEPILAIENIESYVAVPDNIHCDFILRCKGDSMINARILDGDLVMIHQREDIESGEIAAVRIDGNVTLKRVYKYPGMIRLVAENPTFPPMDFNGNNCDEFVIVGKAVAFLSAVR